MGPQPVGKKVKMLYQKIRSLVLLFLAAAGLLSAHALSARPAAVMAGAEQSVAGAQVESDTVSLKGRLVPARWVDLSFPEGGRLAEVPVREGENVPAGAPLAQLDGWQEFAAQAAAAELELLSAQQALDDLYLNAGVELALAGKRLAEAQEALEDADWTVRRLKEGPSALRIEQAHANLLLAEQSLEKARRDLEKAERLWKKRQDPIWYFLSRREFKLNLTLLGQQVGRAERQYVDAADHYDDLIQPVDEIDLLQAEAGLAVAQARVAQASRERDKLLAGPDEDELTLAQARLAAAQAVLRAAGAALSDSQLVAPFAGQVIDLPAKAGGWVDPGQRVLVLAEPSAWQVEIEALEEDQVRFLQAGQSVGVRVDALPDLEISGQVDSISLIFAEEEGEVTYTVEISLQGYDPRLRWGMTARVAFYRRIKGNSSSSP